VYLKAKKHLRIHFFFDAVMLDNSTVIIDTVRGVGAGL